MDWFASLLPLISLFRVWYWYLRSPYQAYKPGKAAKGEAKKYYYKEKGAQCGYQRKQRNRR